MIDIKIIIILLLLSSVVSSCNSEEDILSRQNADEIKSRYKSLYNNFEVNQKIPKSEQGDSIIFVSPDDWTSGFFSGSLYYLYLLSGDEELLDMYLQSLELLKDQIYHDSSHDVGFIISTSFGRIFNYESTDDVVFEQIITEGSISLSKRYNELTETFVAWEHPAFINPRL